MKRFTIIEDEQGAMVLLATNMDTLQAETITFARDELIFLANAIDDVRLERTDRFLKRGVKE